MLISEILEVCKKCQKQGHKGCRMADFQSGKKEEYKYPIPTCITQPTKEPDKKQKKKKEHADNTKQTTLSEIKKIRTVAVPWVWDEIDAKVINAIIEKYTITGISRILKLAKGTIQHRLKRMVKEGLITPYEMINGLSKSKLYNITPKGKKILSISDERLNQTPETQPKKAYPFSSHSNAIVFPVVEGMIPVSDKPYKMNNWTGHVFDAGNGHTDGSHTIRTTTKSIIIEVHVDIGNDSVANLILRYADLAKAYAIKFAEKYKLKLDFLGRNFLRGAHNTLKGNAIGELIAETGAWKTDDGSIRIDKSRSTGDVEFNPDTAMGFEDLINNVPAQVNKIETKIDKVIAHHSTTTQRADTIETGINGIAQNINQLPIFMAMLKENMELKMMLKDYQTTIIEIKGELMKLKEQMKKTGIGQEQPTSTGSRWDRVAYQ